MLTVSVPSAQAAVGLMNAYTEPESVTLPSSSRSYHCGESSRLGLGYLFESQVDGHPISNTPVQTWIAPDILFRIPWFDFSGPECVVRSALVNCYC